MKIIALCGLTIYLFGAVISCYGLGSKREDWSKFTDFGLDLMAGALLAAISIGIVALWIAALGD